MAVRLNLQHFFYSKVKDSGNRRGGGKTLEQSVHGKNKLHPFMMPLLELQTSTLETLRPAPRQLQAERALRPAEPCRAGRAALRACPALLTRRWHGAAPQGSSQRELHERKSKCACCFFSHVELDQDLVLGGLSPQESVNKS